MRILIVTDGLDKGGVEEVILMYARFLDRSRFAVAVSCRRPGTVSREIEALEGVELSCYDAPTQLRRLTGLWKIARAFRPHIVHNHFNWYGLVVGHLVGARCVETIHNVYDWLPASKKVWYSAYLRLATVIIAVSGYVRDRTHELFPVTRKKRFVVIHNGIDVQGFAMASGNLRQKWQILAGEIVAGFIGRLELQKGVTHFLRAIHILKDRVPHLHVVLFGDGSLRSRLESEAREMGLSNVQFVGFERDVARAYRTMDIFVLPSLFEGLPMSLLEAMASGCPVVATTVGGVGEVIDNEVTGLLVPPENPHLLAEAIFRLATDTPLRQAIALRARQHVEAEFSAQTMIARTTELYSAILK